MFYLVSLLFFILSILIYQISNNLNAIEYVTIVVLLFVILTYLFYLDYVKKENFEEVEKQKRYEDCTESENYKIGCEEEWDGYVPLKTWDKISEIPERLNKDLLPELKKTANASSSMFDFETTNQEEAENDIASIDPFYMHQSDKQDIYVKLGVLKKKKKKNDVDMDNIRMDKLQQVSEKADKVNAVLFEFKKHVPAFYQKLISLA